MIVLSNSMPKSGSTLLFIYTQDLVYGRIGSKTPERLSKMIWADTLSGDGGFIRHISKEKMEVLHNHYLNETIVVKGHSRFIPAYDDYAKNGHLKVTYSIRDPRDCLLSGMDNYQRSKDTKKPEFEAFSNLGNALQSIKRHCEKALSWVYWGKALIVRYEDIIDDPREVIRRCCKFLNVRVDWGFINSMISYHEKNKNFRFNTGKTCRFRNEMSDEVVERCDRELGRFISALGYR